MCRDREIKTLVVTGGIGSGKSVVCSMMAQMGVPVYDSDSRTKSLYDADLSLVARISETLRSDVSDGNGRLDRRKLGALVFSDPEKLKLLESVVHPLVREDFLTWKSSICPDCGFVIMESAIILEKPLFAALADRILVVDAPVEVRLERACRRDGADRKAVGARMERQKLLNDISRGCVPDCVDYLLKNESSIDDLAPKVAELFQKLVKMFQ